MASSDRLWDLCKAQLVANGTYEEKYARIVSSLTFEELRDIAASVVPITYERVERYYRADAEYTEMEPRIEFTETGEKITRLVPRSPNFYHEPRIVARDVAGQLERQEVRNVEQEAWRALQIARTRQERLYSFVFLKSHLVDVDGKKVPWHELSTTQRATRRTSLRKQEAGLAQSCHLLDGADSVCREYGVDTLSQAEAADAQAQDSDKAA